MPNDKDHDLSPEEGSEEKKYSFLQETIKQKPVSREQFLKRLIRFAVYGVILGVFACLGFFALKPWMQDWFRGNLKTVTIPGDSEAEDELKDRGQETSSVIDAKSYEEMVSSMNAVAAEARKGIVSVEPVNTEEDWREEMTGISEGVTGVITADNGQEVLILADNSVCARADEWAVVFQDGKKYSATVKKEDKNRGVAVFSVSRSDIEDATWSAIKVSVLGNSNLVSQGDTVIALGHMFGYADGLGYGMVSSTSYKEVFYDGECDVLTTDIPVELEGSGILFNMDGEVVGLISSSIWGKENDENSMVNAYAISDLKPVIELLVNGDSVPYIGTYATTVTSQLKMERGMPSGVYVVDVNPDSPAMAAGIQSGDIICTVDGEKLGSIVTYQSAVLELNVDEQVTFKGKRLGAEGYVDVDFTVTVGSSE